MVAVAYFPRDTISSQRYLLRYLGFHRELSCARPISLFGASLVVHEGAPINQARKERPSRLMVAFKPKCGVEIRDKVAIDRKSNAFVAKSDICE